jgi:hypothetical protein
MVPDPERTIGLDRLYQLPLDQFVQARNELARRAGHDAAPAVRALQKPSVLAWALNQLYWSRRDVFDRLVSAATDLRGAQAQVLLGRPADLRAAGERHRGALVAALREAAAFLETAGHAVTPDAMRDLTGALAALPWEERPGCLARPPAPSGFNLLAGLPVAEGTAAAGGQPTKARPTRVPGARRDEEREAALNAARTAVAAARREEEAGAGRLLEAERRLEAARQRDRAAREALDQAEHQRTQADAEHRAATAALGVARRTTADNVGRLHALDRG